MNWGIFMQPYRPIQPPALQGNSLVDNYNYKEYPPSKNLEPYVACYWTVDYQASDTDILHRIIPDGCVDIIFDLRSPSLSKGAFVAGLMTRFEALNLSESQTLLGIRFFSDTVQYVLGYPVSNFTEYHVFLEDIWGNEAVFMMEKLITANGISEKIKRIEDQLVKILSLHELKMERLLQTSMQYMYATKGMISIQVLTEKLCYSERTIRRTFQKELGINPKELLSIIRFQGVLQETFHDKQSHITDIALRNGYYDQSHFINNFKRYYGLTPNQIF
ncbi:helix-turn-helix transcriptional regulator [Virgibacillus oceani]|uniref:AraC family transcriptional regulator n=1 Tax=Virgibacillus oceani TaxID=1479511 RepID=A0A917M463_9BACI|nr:helix-turn-helix transcriptional regulator [Virgibacillus oceani]GGG74388.1 AraC family transcriptional regulator [Virgibacillus oceani]